MPGVDAGTSSQSLVAWLSWGRECGSQLCVGQSPKCSDKKHVNGSALTSNSGSRDEVEHSGARSSGAAKKRAVGFAGVQASLIFMNILFFMIAIRFYMIWELDLIMTLL